MFPILVPWEPQMVLIVVVLPNTQHTCNKYSACWLLDLGVVEDERQNLVYKVVIIKDIVGK